MLVLYPSHLVQVNCHRWMLRRTSRQTKSWTLFYHQGLSFSVEIVCIFLKGAGFYLTPGRFGNHLKIPWTTPRDLLGKPSGRRVIHSGGGGGGGLYNNLMNVLNYKCRSLSNCGTNWKSMFWTQGYQLFVWCDCLGEGIFFRKTVAGDCRHFN